MSNSWLDDLTTRLQQVSELASKSGALQPIATETEVIEEGGIRFVVHVLTRVRQKHEATARQRKSGENPFLPPDPDLLVADLAPAHRCVLNKFNVLPRHLLIVTRDFQHQQEPISAGDFSALARCMNDIDGLGFYNAGTVAGASQPHKHLQLVPLPVGAHGEPIPFASVLEPCTAPGRLSTCPDLPFLHVLVGLDGRRLEPRDGPGLAQLYRDLADELGLDPGREPYNLLLTSRLMMMVPRCAECFEGISVNALGFVGSLLVKDLAQLELIRQRGPFAALCHVAGRPAHRAPGKPGRSSVG